MQSIENNALFSDLSADEQAELNGGYRCVWAWILQRVRVGYFFVIRYVRVVRCY
jgi:hypothetical protein